MLAQTFSFTWDNCSTFYIKTKSFQDTPLIKKIAYEIGEGTESRLS